MKTPAVRNRYLLFLLFLRRLDWPDSDMAIATACLRLFTLRPDPALELAVLIFAHHITLPTLRFCRVFAIAPLSRSYGRSTQLTVLPAALCRVGRVVGFKGLGPAAGSVIVRPQLG